MYRVIVRIEKTKNFIECDTPTLILLDEPANSGLVAYCSSTGHGEGEYYSLIKHSRRADKEECERALKLYGYDKIKDLKIVNRMNVRSK